MGDEAPRKKYKACARTTPAYVVLRCLSELNKENDRGRKRVVESIRTLKKKEGCCSGNRSTVLEL